MNAPNGQISLTSARAGFAELYAASLSTLCLLHCLALPLFASLLPLTAQLSENELVHQVLVLLAAPATLWVGWHSLATEGGRTFLAAGFSGLALLLAAAFIGTASAYEQPVTTAGALLVAWAHLRRWARYRRHAPQQNASSAADADPGERR